MRTVAASTLAVHRRLQLPAVARNAAGEVLDVPVMWQVADPTIATVDVDGWVTAVAPGVTTVTATCGDVTSNVGVLYVHGPDTAQGQSVGLTVTLQGALTTRTCDVTTTATLLARRTQGVTASTHLAARRSRTTTATASLLGRKSRTVGATARLDAAVTGDSDPAPAVWDTVRTDTRTTLQAATTITAARNAVSAPGPADFTLDRGTRNTTSGWTFHQNFDGAGTKALVVNLTNAPGDQMVRFIHYLQGTKPKRLYVQWKSRLGRHAADSVSNGALPDDFPLFSESNSRKVFLMARDGVGGSGDGRMDYVWTRTNPTLMRAQMDTRDWGSDNPGGSWSAHDHRGEVLTTTVYMQAASANGVPDGVIRIWINGTLHYERTNVPADAYGFDRFEMGTVYHDVPRACCEYLWDLLIWEPGTPPTTVPKSVGAAASLIAAPTGPQAPAAGSANMVGNGGKIFFDTRAGAVSNGVSSGADGGNLQTVGNLTTADALFWDNWGAGSGANSRTFTTNFDGAGTRAYRFQYRQYTSCSGNDEQDVGVRVYPVQSSKRAVYWQWKMWSGRHPNDTGSSHGTVGQFSHNNPDCNHMNNFGRKIAVFGRNQSSGTGKDNRVDLLANGGAATPPYTLIMNGTDFGSGTSWNSGVSANNYLNQVVTVTVYLCAESGANTGDGAFGLWINGEQIINAQNIRTGSANWQANDRGFEAPSVVNGPRYNMVEYWWDIVGWEADPPPDFLEDFSTYSSTANFLSDPRGIYEDVGQNTPRIALDTTTGYGTSTKSLRYDWPNNGSTCADYSINPGMLRIPGDPSEIWLEYVVRFKSNFKVDSGSGSCAAEYKLATLGDPGGTGRWNVPEMQAGQWVTGYPGNEAGYVNSSPAPSSLWDGQPHVFRVHAKIGTASNGIFRFWVDGTLVRSVIGFTSHSSHQTVDWFRMGANLNQGPNIADMQMWWHRVAVWYANPGWD